MSSQPHEALQQVGRSADFNLKVSTRPLRIRAQHIVGQSNCTSVIVQILSEMAKLFAKDKDMSLPAALIDKTTVIETCAGSSLALQRPDSTERR